MEVKIVLLQNKNTLKWDIRHKDIQVSNFSRCCDIEMVDKFNCWDFKKCCKETDSRGDGNNICPVKNEVNASGLNGGVNGGRICWVIMDSHCKQKADTTCFQCEFRYKVMAEEGLLNTCNATGMYLNSLSNNNSQKASTLCGNSNGH